MTRKLTDPRYTVQHSDWGQDPYGWQVLLLGKVLDTYEYREMAEAYADYMNNRGNSATVPA